MSEKENSTGDYRFTIIIPVYNEEENLYTLEEKLQQFLPHSLFQACVLFVDDGSKDDSQRRIREICACIDTAAKREGETDAGTPLPRLAGTSKYHLWNRLYGPFIDCFAYRWMKKRYINYHVQENNLD
jgi:glycosyltransferase involved in cell wall biosynthesis